MFDGHTASTDLTHVFHQQRQLKHTCGDSKAPPQPSSATCRTDFSPATVAFALTCVACAANSHLHSLNFTDHKLSIHRASIPATWTPPAASTTSRSKTLRAHWDGMLLEFEMWRARVLAWTWSENIIWTNINSCLPAFCFPELSESCDCRALSGEICRRW